VRRLELGDGFGRSVRLDNLSRPGSDHRLGDGGSVHRYGWCDYRWRRRRLPHRQQAERVDVAVRVGGDTNAQMNVWLEGDGVAALTDHAHLGRLGDRVAPSNTCCGELE
jgi:hypothetical protein